MRRTARRGRRGTYKFLLERQDLIEQDGQLGTLLNNTLHGLVSTNIFRQFELHGIFVLADAGDDADVVAPHLEVVPWVWQAVALAYPLLVGGAVDIVVEFRPQPLGGDRSQAGAKVSQDGVEH